MILQSLKKGFSSSFWYFGLSKIITCEGREIPLWQNCNPKWEILQFQFALVSSSKSFPTWIVFSPSIVPFCPSARRNICLNLIDTINIAANLLNGKKIWAFLLWKGNMPSWRNNFTAEQHAQFLPHAQPSHLVIFAEDLVCCWFSLFVSWFWKFQESFYSSLMRFAVSRLHLLILSTYSYPHLHFYCRCA